MQLEQHATQHTHVTFFTHLIEKYGRRYPLDVGGLNVKVEAPVSRLVTGIKPETLGDLDDILTYTEEQITQILAVGTHRPRKQQLRL